MNHPFQESLNNIEKHLEEINKFLLKIQSNNVDNLFIENNEFQKLMKISPRTAANWRDQGLIAFSQINTKIFYKMTDVIKLIDENYQPLKKKR